MRARAWTTGAALARRARRLLLLAVLMAGLLAGPRGALAHAALVEAAPTDGASLAEGPAAVTLRFDEVVTPLALRVVGPNGAEVPLASLPAPGALLQAPLPPGLAPGVYLVGWRVVSADGHPIAGALAFGVGTTAAPAAAPTDDAQAGRWMAMLQGLRLLLYAALVAAAGGALFRALIMEPPRRVRRGMLGAGCLGAAAAVLSVGAMGGLLAAAPLEGLLSLAVWRAGAGSPVAASLGACALGFGLAAAAAGAAHPAARWLGVGGAVIVALGLPLAGHAVTAEPRWLAAMALAVHAIVVAFWLGSLWPLRALLTDRGAGCLPAVERFSRLALPAVAALLAAGVTLAALRLRTVQELFGSAYGQLVLLKACGLALLLLLAGLNRQRLTPALATNRGGAAARLSRSILAEMVVAAAVLCATSVLVRTPPPSAAGHATMDHAHHSAVAGASDSVLVATEAAGLTALVEIAPGRAGPNRLAVILDSASGAALPPPAEVWAEFTQTTAGVGPIRRQLRPEGKGRFVYDGPEFALPGRWSVRVEVLVSDFEQVSLQVRLDLLPAAP